MSRLLIALTFLLGCSVDHTSLTSNDPASDAAALDGAALDGAALDGAALDAPPFDAARDAGALDSGELDAGDFDAARDAGELDSGELDAGPLDAGPVDSGSCVVGAVRDCGEEVGACVLGRETCEGGTWSACEGGVVSTDEVCNGLDDDCDGAVDNGVLSTFFRDGDGDDVGGPDSELACAPSEGFIALGGDCNDEDEDINPSATEECDLVDNNCNGSRDEGDVCDSGCQPVEHDGHVYLFCTDGEGWTSARDRCRDTGAAYELVSIESEAENSFVTSTGQAIQSGSEWHIGLNDRDSERNHSWVSGSSGSYRNWARWQPDDFLSEDCVELRSGGDWNDVDCNAQRWFICEGS